jgi:GlcNAc-P-P-Und epimerase
VGGRKLFEVCVIFGGPGFIGTHFATHLSAWVVVECPWIIFTSSIAPYGPTEEGKDENPLPVPIAPYGVSKLAAEKIRLGWQRVGQERRLAIVRPGVVFGPGEGGNVSLMIKAGLGRYFPYLGFFK